MSFFSSTQNNIIEQDKALILLHEFSLGDELFFTYLRIARHTLFWEVVNITLPIARFLLYMDKWSGPMYFHLLLFTMMLSFYISITTFELILIEFMAFDSIIIASLQNFWTKISSSFATPEFFPLKKLFFLNIKTCI